jgi:putative hemolysin
MNFAVRLFLSLWICLVLPLQVEAVSLPKEMCANQPVSAMQASPATSLAAVSMCHQDGGQVQPMGGVCKIGAACGLNVPAPATVFRLLALPDQRASYPPIFVHFILQDFPQTLLRPPSLG